MKNMKKIFCIVGSLILSLTCFNANADTFSKPYIGLELLQSNMRFVNFYGDTVFAKNPQFLNIFTGIKFHDNFGIEAGYGIQKRKKRTSKIYDGESVGGTTYDGAGLSAWQVYQSSIKSRQLYLGIFGEDKLFCMDKAFFKILIGISSTYTDGWLYPEYDAQEIFSHADRSLQRRSFKKHKILPIVRASVMYKITDNFNFGFTGSWRQLSRVKIFSEQYNDRGNEIRLKNAFSAGLRASYTLIN